MNIHKNLFLKILYIHQYFKTPEEGGAIRSYYIASGLVSNNITVDLITAHNKKIYEIKNINGITVHYLPVPYDNKMGFYKRIRSFLKFFIRATILSFKIKDIDACYATSTPLTVGFISFILKKIKKVPYYFEVRDLWPEAPIQLGIIKNPVLKLVLRRLEILIYKEAKAIIGLSPGIQSHIIKKSHSNKTFFVPNMCDIDFFKESAKAADKVQEDDMFNIVYFGALGKSNRVDSILAIAREAKINLPTVRFQIMGEGALLPLIIKQIQIDKLDNIKVYEFQDKNKLREILRSADASYISYQNIPILETSSPNKFFDSIAAGKLVIINIKGWLFDLVHKYSIGIYIDTDIEGDFSSKILPFIKDRELLKTYQKSAQRLAQEQFSKEQQVKIIVAIIRGDQTLINF